jgi:ribosomal protein S6--L-glutamate ligase
MVSEPWPHALDALSSGANRSPDRAPETEMRFAMLARNPNLYSHQRIVHAAQRRGHTVDVINTLQVHMNITSSRPTLWYGGRTLPLYDAVIPRIGASITHFGLAVLRQFEMQGVFPLNESVAIGRARDKLRALQLLARRGIGLPVTTFAHGPKTAASVIEEVGGTPVVIKLLEGTQGMGVILAETNASAVSIIEAFSAANVNIMVQEFIEEARGTDVRAFVVGGRVVAAMKRTGRTSDFRSNLHRGGRADPTEISPEERDTAISAAEALGLNVCGIDMLRSKRGPLVIEVNSSPGLRGIETASGVDIAASITDFLEINARHGNTETKGNG